MQSFRGYLVGSVLTGLLVFTTQPQHVARVIDGDTFTLWHVGIPPEERVRVLGVNCPEKSEPLFTEATDFTKSWLNLGQSVTITVTGRDNFGRLLATIRRHDGRSLSEDLIGAGLCKRTNR